MRIPLLIGGAAAVAFTLACGGGSSGIGGGTPLYGAETVSAGFSDITVEVRAGGGTAVEDLNLDFSCVGYITPDQPDYRLTATSPGAQIRFAACSDADTALVIRDPSGTWHCNDDTEGTNPVVEVKGPLAGDYDVWVATYSMDGTQDATLHVTEADGAICTRIDADAEPKAGTTTVAPGSGRRQVTVTAGGREEAAAPEGMEHCAGYIDGSAPQVNLDVTGQTGLSVASCAEADTTLAIRGPDGTWHCDDDTEGTNPVVRIPSAAPGTYNVFVGNFAGGDTDTATLMVKGQASGLMCMGG